MTEKFWRIHFTEVEPPPAAEFRYAAGPGVPDFLVGKTMAEAADLTAKLYEALVERREEPDV